MLGHMPAEGWFILLATFILFTMTGGFQVLRIGAADSPSAERNYSRSLVENKCGHCHSLERVYAREWDANSARLTVERMREYSTDWISIEDAEKITVYLTLDG